MPLKNELSDYYPDDRGLSDNPMDPVYPELRTTFGSKPGAFVRGLTTLE